MSTATKSIADGGGQLIDDLIFPRGPAGVVTTLAAGTGVLQVSCDPESVIRDDPADASLRWAELASLTGVAPTFTEIPSKVTAIRVLPSGGACEVRASW